MRELDASFSLSMAGMIWPRAGVAGAALWNFNSSLSRSEVVEGVVVGKGSVISMGVFLGQSTRILNRETGKISYGYVPPGSVVVSGSIPSKDGSHSLYCAVIVKTVDEKTRSKVGINELVRNIQD